MNQNELEVQADMIETLLRQHKAPARCMGGNVTPHWIQFLLQPAPGVKVNRVESLSREIAQALGASTATITRHNGTLRIDVPRCDPQPVSLSKIIARLPRERIPLGTAVLGLASDGAPLLVRFPSSEVRHVLIVGDDDLVQSLLRVIALSLAEMFRPGQVQLNGFAVKTANGSGPIDLATMLNARQRENFKAPLLIAQRDLRQADSLKSILESGPQFGIHLALHTSDRKAIGAQNCLIVLRQIEARDFIAESPEGEIRFTPAADLGQHVNQAEDRQPRPLIAPIDLHRHPARE